MNIISVSFLKCVYVAFFKGFLKSFPIKATWTMYKLILYKLVSIQRLEPRVYVYCTTTKYFQYVSWDLSMR